MRDSSFQRLKGKLSKRFSASVRPFSRAGHNNLDLHSSYPSFDILD